MENTRSFLDLNTHEKNILLPLVVQIMEHRDTKEKVFSNGKIRNVLKEFGEDISDAQIRKLVFNIRNNGIIELLIANQDGYFVSNNIDDIRAWIARHKGKISAMTKTLESIESQFENNMNRLNQGSSGLMGQLSIFDMADDAMA